MSEDRVRDGWLDTRRAELLTIGLLLALTLYLRLALLPHRWINPDEGAHLMDAFLVHRGYVPDVDYISRQPLYVYAMAGFLELTGVSLRAGRLFPLICSLLVGVPLFVLARDLFGRGQALLAVAIWWMLPFEIHASSVVKTEPFVMLITLTSVLAVVRSVNGTVTIRSSGTGRSFSAAWMAAAGFLAAAGFYVRQSALVIPPVVLVYLLIRHGRRIGPTIRAFAVFVAGYCGMCMVVALFYSRWVGAAALVEFTPVEFISGALHSAARTLPAASVDQLLATGHAYGENAAEYLRAVKDGVFFQLFLIVAAGFAGLHWLRSQWIRLHRRPMEGADDEGRSHEVQADSAAAYRDGLGLALTWVVLLALAYAWRFSQRGFWVDYSREFAPPLILAFVGWLAVVVPALRKRGAAIQLIAGTVVIGSAWVLFQRRFRTFYGLGNHLSLGIVLFLLFWHAREFARTRRTVFVAGMAAAVALVVGVRYAPFAGTVASVAETLLTLALAVVFAGWMLRRDGHRPGRELRRSLPIGVVVGSLVLTLSYGALRFNIKYQGLWSPEALADVTHYLRNDTSPEDRVMSGGVVWALDAHRLPWHMYSHPMAIQRVLPVKERRALTRAFEANPPAVVVMDGITQRTFGPNIENLDGILATRYRLVMVPKPVSFDVKVYRRLGGAPGATGTAGAVNRADSTAAGSRSR